jgi:hypothetical protein
MPHELKVNYKRCLPMFTNYRFLGITLAGMVGISMACLPAMASLGGDVNSVKVDSAHMKAQLQVQQKQAYAVHEIKDKNGITVREYVSPQGKVFGVAWQGPFLPDMQQVLGMYTQQYSAALKQDHIKNKGRHPLNIHQPGLVIETGGHMRAYYGRVYVPQMVPTAVAAGEIR